MTRTWLESKDVDVEQLEYDEQGRLKHVVIRDKDEPPGEEHYHYDDLGRLARIESAERPQTFTFDSLGRMVKVTGVMPQAIKYDASGRVQSMIDVTTSPAGKWAFHYDAAGRLVEELRDDGWRIGYRYNCNGQ